MTQLPIPKQNLPEPNQPRPTAEESISPQSETAPISKTSPNDRGFSDAPFGSPNADDAVPTNNSPPTNKSYEDEPTDVDLPKNPIVAPDPDHLDTALDEDLLSALGIDDEEISLPSNDILDTPSDSSQTDELDDAVGESDDKFWDEILKNKTDEEAADAPENSIEEQIKALLDSDIGIPENAVEPNPDRASDRGSLRDRLRIRQMSLTRSNNQNTWQGPASLKERLRKQRRPETGTVKRPTERAETLLEALLKRRTQK